MLVGMSAYIEEERNAEFDNIRCWLDIMLSFPLFVMLAIAKHVRQIIHHRVLECIKFVFSTSPDDPLAGLKGLLLRIRGGERRAEGEGRDGGKGGGRPRNANFWDRLWYCYRRLNL